MTDLGLRAAVHDYDQDGDLDLFFGGRLVPKNWPLSPRSVVLQNNGGKFTDVTSQVAGAFERCGMVTDLSWNDLNGDGQKGRVIVPRISLALNGDYGWLNNTASPLTLGGQALYVPELANSSEYGPFMRIDLMPDLPT